MEVLPGVPCSHDVAMDAVVETEGFVAVEDEATANAGMGTNAILGGI